MECEAAWLTRQKVSPPRLMLVLLLVIEGMSPDVSGSKFFAIRKPGGTRPPWRVAENNASGSCRTTNLPSSSERPIHLIAAPPFYTRPCYKCAEFFPSAARKTSR